MKPTGAHQPTGTLNARYDLRAEQVDALMKPEQAYPQFAANDGGFVATWNWAAFFFGALWYLVNAIWVKGLAICLIALLTHGLAIPVLWVYCGVFGNWDHYLLKRLGSQLWGRGQLATVVGVATGRTKRCPFCAEFIQPEAKVCRYCERDLPATGHDQS